jgi:GAF domain-containing protein
MHVDPAALARSLETFERFDPGTRLEDALHQLVEGAQAVFDVTGAGLMFVDEDESLHYVAASDGPGRVLESLQEQVGEGPCVDALVYDRPVTTDDVHADERWPALAPLIAEHPVRAVLGVPVEVVGTAVGSLDVYRDHPFRWDDSDVAALEAYAGLVDGIVATGLRARQQDRLVGQLQHALDHRVVVERAVGFLMAREQTDAVAAFNHLRARARRERTKVAITAARLLGHSDPKT